MKRIWRLLNKWAYGIPSNPAEHVDWTIDTKPIKKLNVKTVDAFPTLTPLEREIELYKDKVKQQ